MCMFIMVTSGYHSLLTKDVSKAPRPSTEMVQAMDQVAASDQLYLNARKGSNWFQNFKS